ncbi:MAG: hypothetical protein B7X59_10900 [Polaromonas sp. 39-63-203]|nr:MAG: hypothetical protein B7X59_10900 [Polaromonas sp. 39-63-203]
MADGPGGFLGRWARRKNDALQGRPLQEPAAELPAAPVVAHSAVPSVLPQAGSDPPPAPAASDFKPFMAGNVGPDVRNAAMKKLFADPHFNVMDGLDIYIDDYSISEPIPESMLRQMASAKFLKLFEDDSEDEQRARESAESGQAEASTSRENANVPADESVAHSSDQPQADEPCTTSLSNPLDCRQPGSFEDADARTQDHDHTDLRLQPDDAASGPQAGRCA